MLIEEAIKILPNKTKVFIHCYSRSVINLLNQAHKAGKKFTVYNTEIRPKLLGRRAAKELASKGIKVIHLPDLAGPETLKLCDIFLFGSEEIKKNGTIINKIGTKTLLSAAKEKNIPSYCISKKNKATRTRINTTEQLWKTPPKNVSISNPGHEEIRDKSITIIELTDPLHKSC
jgi:translation initiation factor 2B subunit (eIF-2B alpha/beta/delta family)